LRQEAEGARLLPRRTVPVGRHDGEGGPRSTDRLRARPVRRRQKRRLLGWSSKRSACYVSRQPAELNITAARFISSAWAAVSEAVLLCRSRARSAISFSSPRTFPYLSFATSFVNPSASIIDWIVAGSCPLSAKVRARFRSATVAKLISILSLSSIRICSSASSSALIADCSYRSARSSHRAFSSV